MSSERFSAENRHRLLNEERLKLQPAEEIIARMKVNADDIVADLGCGIGYITIPLSKKVKRVWALDGQVLMLEDLQKRTPAELKDKITPIIGELPSLPFEDSSLDCAVMVNVAHELEDAHKMAAEIMRCLKNEGILTIVDFNKKPSPFGPPLTERIEMNEMIELYRPLKLINKHDCGIYYQIDLQNSKN